MSDYILNWNEIWLRLLFHVKSFLSRYAIHFHHRDFRNFIDINTWESERIPLIIGDVAENVPFEVSDGNSINRKLEIWFNILISKRFNWQPFALNVVYIYNSWCLVYVAFDFLFSCRKLQNIIVALNVAWKQLHILVMASFWKFKELVVCMITVSLFLSSAFWVMWPCNIFIMKSQNLDHFRKKSNGNEFYDNNCIWCIVILCETGQTQFKTHSVVLMFISFR